MERFALLGWPVKHSLSPPMQEAGLRALGIDATYELIEVPPDALQACIDTLRKEGYRGWNVTIPHKENVARLLLDIDTEARAAQSVNTVLNRNGTLSGYSTDGYGLATAIAEAFSMRLADKHILFLGAGGAARAVAIYFSRHGTRAITIANRTLANARELVDCLTRVSPNCLSQAVALHDEDAMREQLDQADIVIQATSLGLHRDDPAPIDPGLIRKGCPVIDMIYRTTRLLEGAAKNGCPTADGRGMLLHQGARSLQIWTNSPAPVSAMRHALDLAMAQRSQ